MFNFLADFKRANRRMHNKSFIVDNQVAIVGGRNIADEYFELNPRGVFLDLDVIALGPVAQQVSAEFDEFWNDSRSLPMAAFASRFSAEDLIQARAEIDETMRTVVDSTFNAAVDSQLLHDLIDGRQKLYSARAEVITDHPSKLTSEIATEQEILVQRLAEVISVAEKEVIVFTPYFVPQDAGVAFWESVVNNGVRVIILTNSLASNNHTSVHAGYARYRKAILEAGVELYEARVNAVDHSDGNEAEKLTLHTKAMVIDREIVFVGSLNLDPRSIEINSEMGVLIHSSELGEELAASALQIIPSIAYRVELNSKGKLQWRATIDGEEVIETSEPLASAWRKFSAFLLKIVPESQL
jgi:putative cardiolipin synthase